MMGSYQGDLYDERVETMISQRFEKLDDAEFERLLTNAPYHPDYDSYCQGVKVEQGLEDGDWTFGQEEPFYDLVGLHAWSFSRQNLRDRLALGMALPSNLMSGLAAKAEKPLQEKSKVETPAPTPPAKVETPPKVETSLEPPKVETPPAKVETPVPTPPTVKPPAPAAKVHQFHAPAPPAPAAPRPSELSGKVSEIAANIKRDNLPTSVSHRSEYMAFLRAGRNPSKMTKTLLPMFQGERLDLFRLWLEKGQDFAQVEVEVTRRNVQSQSAKAKDVCMSKSQLEADPRYSKDDVADLIKRKTQLGQYIDDPNFPGREDLRQYIINAETSAETARVREDVQQVGSRMSVTGTEALALTEAGCDFAFDSHPSIKGISQDLGVVAAPGEVPAPTGNGETKKKGRAKGKAKAKAGAGDKNKGDDQEGGEGEEKDNQPDKPPTPLAKAVALKTKV